MRRIVAVMLGLIMLVSAGAMAEARPSWVPEGFSYYAEPDFSLWSAIAMEDGGVVLAGYVRAEPMFGLAVRLSADGEVVWRYEERATELPIDVLGTLPDGDVLLVCYMGGGAFVMGVDDMGRSGLLDGLTTLTGQGETAQTLRRLPDGFVFVEKDPHLEGAADAVRLDDTLGEVCRVKLSRGGELPALEFVPTSDGGMFVYGSVRRYDGGPSYLLVAKVSATGDVLWSLEDEGGSLIAALSGTKDGGVLMLTSRMPEDGAEHVEQWLTRLDAGGKVVMSRPAGPAWGSLFGIVRTDEGFVAGGYGWADTPAMTLVSEEGETLGMWFVPQDGDGEVQLRINLKLSQRPSGGTMAIGQLYREPSLEALPELVGVIWRPVDAGMFE